VTRPSSRRGPRRQLVRESDGTLLDLTTGQEITPPELRDFVTGGGFFEARREDGTECTMQVLTEVLQDAAADRRRHRGQAPPGSWRSPGPTGPTGPLEPMGALVGAVPSPAALEPLAQLLALWGWGDESDPRSGPRARPRGFGARRRRDPS
jgi:hypothetical protein